MRDWFEIARQTAGDFWAGLQDTFRGLGPEAIEERHLERLGAQRRFSEMMPNMDITIHGPTNRRDLLRLRPEYVSQYTDLNNITPQEFRHLDVDDVEAIERISREYYPDLWRQHPQRGSFMSVGEHPMGWPATQTMTVVVNNLKPIGNHHPHAASAQEIGLSPSGGWGQGPNAIRASTPIVMDRDRSNVERLLLQQEALISVLGRFEGIEQKIYDDIAAGNAAKLSLEIDRNNELAAAFKAHLAQEQAPTQISIGHTQPSGPAGQTAETRGRPPLPPEVKAEREAAQRAEKNRKRREERAARRAASEDTGGL